MKAFSSQQGCWLARNKEFLGVSSAEGDISFLSLYSFPSLDLKLRLDLTPRVVTSHALTRQMVALLVQEEMYTVIEVLNFRGVLLFKIPLGKLAWSVASSEDRFAVVCRKGQNYEDGDLVRVFNVNGKEEIRMGLEPYTVLDILLLRDTLIIQTKEGIQSFSRGGVPIWRSEFLSSPLESTFYSITAGELLCSHINDSKRGWQIWNKDGQIAGTLMNRNRKENAQLWLLPEWKLAIVCQCFTFVTMPWPCGTLAGLQVGLWKAFDELENLRFKKPGLSTPLAGSPQSLK